MLESSHSAILVSRQKIWWRRNLKALLVKGTAAFLLLVFTTILLHGNWPLALLCVGGGLGLWSLGHELQRRYERAEILAEVEAMSEGEFRRHVADLLRSQGYTVHIPDRPGEPQNSFLLLRGRETIGCWILRQPGRIGKMAVARVVATMATYRDRRVMILANRSFTFFARRLARRKGYVLVDREALTTMVVQYRQGHRVLAFHREETARVRRRK